jgi:hypothetical protein
MKPLTQDDVYRKLQQLLTVEPSPNFVARVRASVANQPTRSVVGLRHAITVSVTVAVLLIAVAVYFVSPRLDDTVASTPDRRVESFLTLTPDAGSASPQAVRPAPPTRTVRTSLSPERRALEPSLQVMISADDAHAFERFVRSAGDGTIVLVFEETNKELALAELTIAPIATEPLTIPEQQGVVQ